MLIDGLSVGRCPQNSRVNVALLIAALHYYRKRGVSSVCVLLPADDCSTARDLRILLALREKGLLVAVPDRSDFDAFLLRSALLRGADIVSNRVRRFEGVLHSQRHLVDYAALWTYLRSHLIPFAFVLGLFMPNPDRRSIALGLHGPRVARRSYARAIRDC